MEKAKDNLNISNLGKTCFHCGEECPSTNIKFEEKPFCCEGCKMVFEILQEGDLCNYYDIEQQPGISLKGKRNTDYDFLKDESIIEKLIDFTDGQTTKVSFYLPQIHCASCIWLLENLYKLSDGVISSRVNFLKKEVYISFDSTKKTLQQIVELLASIGYAPEINFSQLDHKARRIVDKSLYYKLGIAGFAFGNIMLFSFPEYLGLQSLSFSHLFGYLNILLAIPVLLYCGRDYLQSAWLGLKNRQLNIDVPVSLGMLALFGRSVFEIVMHTGAGYLDSLAGLVFFLLIGKWFQQKTYHTISFQRDYKSYFPIAATIKKEESWTSLPLDKIEIGDTLLIRNQELIPTDSILIKGAGNVDYSFVTGEANLISKTIGDKLYAGGKQIGNSIEVAVRKKVEQSYLTQLWNESAFHRETESKSSRLANQIGTFFTIIILVVAFSTLAFWLSYDWSIAVNAFTSVLIIACPCAVALAIPFTYGNLLRILAGKQFYMKNTQVIESIQEVSHIVLDKTGTITDTKFQKVNFKGQKLSPSEQSMIKSLVNESSHPLSRKIQSFLKNVPELEIRRFREYAGLGIQADIDGNFIRLGSSKFIFNENNSSIKIEEKGVFVEINNEVKGCFVFQSQYRKGLLSFIQTLKSKFKLSLLSGDNDAEKQRLQAYFKNDKNLHFNQSPKDKLTFIDLLQHADEKVMMIGDGLNDAGALEQSDVGIVIAEDINNFTPACDVIVSADQFRNIPNIIEYIQKSKNVLFGAYILALIYNVVGLSYAVQGLLSPVIAAILMPLSSVTIVVFGVGLSTFLSKFYLKD
jgi:Cu+-exporting ATPase